MESEGIRNCESELEKKVEVVKPTSSKTLVLNYAPTIKKRARWKRLTIYAIVGAGLVAAVAGGCKAWYDYSMGHILHNDKELIKHLPKHLLDEIFR